jgi:tRNA(Ile)-lysidine synthase
VPTSARQAAATFEARFAGVMAGLASDEAAWPGAVAVSGGSDSVALMHLLASWATRAGVKAPAILTVDHGLRAGSAADARMVVRWARALDLKATVLRWTGPRPDSDIEAEAREARYRLMGAWLRKHRIASLYVAHTEDDQAETFLLRLMRGSGLDGLSAMRPVAGYPLPAFADLRLIRPLLSIDRAALRAHLEGLDQSWLEDPMNSEERFARVRLRNLMPQLHAAGVTRTRIAAAAAHLTRARDALDTVTGAVLARCAQPGPSGFQIDTVALTAAPREIGLRALARLLMEVSRQTYRPRFERLERLYDRLATGTLGGGTTLHGCRIAPIPANRGVFGAGTVAIAREARRATRESVPT